MAEIKDIVAAKTIKIPLGKLISINGLTLIGVIFSYLLVKAFSNQFLPSTNVKDWIDFFDYVSKPMTLVIGGSSIYFAFKTFDANQRKWADEIETRETKRVEDMEKAVMERQEAEVLRRKKIIDELIPSFHHINSELSNSVFDLDKLILQWSAYPDGGPKDTLIANVKKQKLFLEERKRKIQATAFLQVYKIRKSGPIAILDVATTRNYVAIFELERLLLADESDLQDHLGDIFFEERDYD